MRKILSTSFILLIFLMLAWGMAAWYFSNITESGIKSYFVKNNDLSGEQLFRAELIEYHKTLLGAKAKIRITSDHSLFNSATNEIVLIASAINGPLFISKTNFVINFGVSRWNIKIDKTSLDEETLVLLDRVFLEDIPAFIITHDFEEKLLYQSDANSAIAQLKLTGVFDYINNNNKGSLLMKNLQLGQFPDQIKTEQVVIHYQYFHDADSNKEYKPATIHLEIPQLSIDHHSFGEAVEVGVTADAALLNETHNKVAVLNGLLQLNLKQLKHVAPFKIPIKYAEVKLQFDKIPIQGLIQISEQRAEEDNLQKQIQWLLDENGEFPEGQDQIWQLNDEIKILRKQSASRYAALFLSNKSSNVRITANTDDQDQYAKKSTFKGKLHLKEDRRVSLNNTVNNLDLLVGEAEVSLTNNLFTYFNTQKVKTKIVLKNNAFKLYLKNGNISINE